MVKLLACRARGLGQGHPTKISEILHSPALKSDMTEIMLKRHMSSKRPNQQPKATEEQDIGLIDLSKIVTLA